MVASPFLINSVLCVHRTWPLSTCTKLTLLCYDIIIAVNGSLSGGLSVVFLAAMDRVAVNTKHCQSPSVYVHINGRSI